MNKLFPWNDTNILNENCVYWLFDSNFSRLWGPNHIKTRLNLFNSLATPKRNNLSGASNKRKKSCSKGLFFRGCIKGHFRLVSIVSLSKLAQNRPFSNPIAPTSNLLGEALPFSSNARSSGHGPWSLTNEAIKIDEPLGNPNYAI